MVTWSTNMLWRRMRWADVTRMISRSHITSWIRWHCLSRLLDFLPCFNPSKLFKADFQSIPDVLGVGPVIWFTLGSDSARLELFWSILSSSPLWASVSFEACVTPPCYSSYFKDRIQFSLFLFGSLSPSLFPLISFFYDSTRHWHLSLSLFLFFHG